MTAPRPTDTQVGTTLQQLYALAVDDPDTYRDLEALIALADWLRLELAAARHAAAYGAGTSEVHVLGHSTRGVDTRLNDQLLNHLRKLRRAWISKRGALLYDLQDDARQAANWPTRTETG